MEEGRTAGRDVIEALWVVPRQPPECLGAVDPVRELAEPWDEAPYMRHGSVVDTNVVLEVVIAEEGPDPSQLPRREVLVGAKVLCEGVSQ